MIESVETRPRHSSSRVRWVVSLALSALVGCAEPDLSPSSLDSPVGTVGVRPLFADAGTPSPDAGPPGPPTLTLDALAPSYPMDDVVGHEWGAQIPLASTVTGSPAITRVEYYAGAVFLGSSDESPFEVDGELASVGERTIVAIGRDAAGNELARDEAVIDVTATTDPSCHAMLDVLGIEFEVLGDTLGIDDPVRIQPYINGVSFRYFQNTSPTRMRMDCTLAVRLHELTEIVKPSGIDEISHMGTYNYRCIGGVPLDDPECNLSRHSFGLAIDIAGFWITASDTEYSVNDDWIITDGPTCPGDPSGVPDTLLHEYACAMWDLDVFQTILTPNYNTGHRNHFHVDMGGSFLKDAHGVLPLGGVDPEGEVHAH